MVVAVGAPFLEQDPMCLQGCAKEIVSASGNLELSLKMES